MSVEADKAIPQEQATAPTTLATGVVGASETPDITEKAKPDGEEKADGETDQSAATAAVVVPKAGEPVVGNDATLVSNDVGGQGVTNGEAKLSGGAESAPSEPVATQPAVEPVLGVGTSAPAAVSDKAVGKVVPEISEKPAQNTSDEKSADATNGVTREDAEMSEAPNHTAVAKEETVKQVAAPVTTPAPVPALRGKRKVEEAFADDENDLAEKKAKAEVDAPSAVADAVPVSTKKPGRPKKQQQQQQQQPKPRNILTPVGRTLRKTRSQGPVEI